MEAMFRMDSNCFEVLKDSLNGQRAVDEETYESISVLEDRLRELQKLGGMFENVGFSSEVKKLADERSKIAVC